MATFRPMRNQMKIVTGRDANDAWRLSLPKDACRYLGWGPGDTVEVSVPARDQIVLKKVDDDNNSKI